MADVEAQEQPAAAPGKEDSPGNTHEVPESSENQENGGGEQEEESGDDAIAVDEDSQTERVGTTASARFNILSTMVGGGSLSLPLAFRKSGNAFTAPVLLLGTAVVTEFCFRLLVRSARTLHPVSAGTSTPGSDSFESIAAAAFGPKALTFSKILVVLMCFFGTVGYAVLLRDMLEPVTHALYHDHSSSSSSNETNTDNTTSLDNFFYNLTWETAENFTMAPTQAPATSPSLGGPSWQGNSVMLTIVLLVTPLCTLKTLTALKRFGAASMFSVLVLGCCVLFRSVECNIRDFGDWSETFRLFPEKWMDILDVIPLYISCYVCHYNIPAVHNELRKPSEERVFWWLRSTTWSASVFYLVLGLSGSAYAKCSVQKKISGNILLDFEDTDRLILVGRMCLAITITLAFPMLTIPARDIVLRSMHERRLRRQLLNVESAPLGLSSESSPGALSEPLLQNDQLETESSVPVESPAVKTTFGLRLGIAIILFWSAAAVASCVSSIDIVWDLLGSSLSIILSYLIPCGSYIVIMRQSPGTPSRWQKLSIVLAWLLVLVTGPLMIVSTANAIRTTFFSS